MGNNASLILLAGLLAFGCKSVRALRPTETIPLDFQGRVALARMQAAAAEAGPAADRITAAKIGIAAAQAARADHPDRVEGQYWYAINVGLLADADRSYGLNAVGEMQAALQRAIELDETYDHGGPLRVMGLLLLRTPAPPVSIGSPRRGLRLLQRAVAVAPEYPENYLHLAEAWHAIGRIDEARAALHKVLAAPPMTGREAESAHWRRAAEARLAEWR